MRLTCPNCGARYEVDEAMIPPEGRDVQCSNCTTTWFQPGLQQSGDDPAEPAPPPEPPSPAHREPTRPIPVSEARPTTRRELAPEVRDVLREEAEREAELRRREGELPEHQDEMPLQAPEDPDLQDGDDVRSAIGSLLSSADEIGDLEDAPRERARDTAAARYNGADDVDDALEAQIAAAAGAGAAAGSRRDLLPDIEEINSTLRATESRSASDPDVSDIDTMVERPRRRTGTRLGFALVILVFAGLIGVYANAGRIAEALPQVEPALDGYVTQVNRLRLWIDEIAHGALTSDDPAADSAAAVEPVTPEIAPADAEQSADASATDDETGDPAEEPSDADEGAVQN